MTNNNFNNLLGYFLVNNSIQFNTLSNLKVLKYNGTGLTTTGSSTNVGLPSCFIIAKVFGEANVSSGEIGIFLTLGTDDTPPTRSDLKLGNSVEDFVWLGGSRLAGIDTKTNEFLMFNSVVIYKGSSPIIIKEMGLNCIVNSQKFLLARETIEPLVINPDDTYSFVMRIK
jgi:hypothetical protein